MAEEALWKTLEALLRRHGIAEKLREQLVVAEWSVEAPPIARGSKALYVREKVLFLGVTSHALAQELNLRKGEILRDLREKGYEVVDIKFQVLPPELPSPPERLEIEVTAADEAWARRALGGRDLPPLLRERMVAFLAAAKARERAMMAAGARRCRSCGVAFFGEGEVCPVCRAEEGEAGG